MWTALLVVAVLVGIVTYWIAQAHRDHKRLRERQQRLTKRGVKSHRLENPDWIPGHGGGASGG